MLKKGIDMNFVRIILFFLLIVLSSTVIFGQELNEKSNDENLDRIADDLKFSNGVQFVNLKRHDKAIEVLSEYLEIFHDGIHRDEAYRHIADIHFKRFNYLKAINSYKLLFEEFSTSDEGVRAYFQIGICYKKMGYDIKAKEVFREITQKYPESSVANQSRIQVDFLNIIE